MKTDLFKLVSVSLGLIFVSLSNGCSESDFDPPPPLPPPPQQTFLIGLDIDGFQADTGSENGGTTNTGRYTAIVSDTPLIGNEVGSNVYVYDRNTDSLTLISRPDVTVNETYANGDSWDAQISLDGRFVFFLTVADNLQLDAQSNWADNNGLEDVYVHDRDLDGNNIFDEVSCGLGVKCTQVKRVSVDDQGFELIDPISGPGQGVGVTSYTISGNGEHVAFYSACPPRTSGFCNGMLPPEVNLTEDHGALYLHDRDPDGNGTYDEHTILGGVKTIWVDSTSRPLGSTGFYELVPTDPFSLAMNYYGRHVAYALATDQLDPGDDGQFFQVYVRDRDANSTGFYDNDVYDSLVSISEITRDAGFGDSTGPTMTSIWPGASPHDARFIAFHSAADDLDIEDQNLDIFDIITFDRDYDRDGVFDELEDNNAYEVDIVSLDEDGFSSNGDSFDPRLSGNARYIIFQTQASNIGDISSNRPGYPGVFKHYWVDRDYDEDGEYDEFDFDSEVVTAWVEKTYQGFFGSEVPAVGLIQPLGAISADGQEVGFTSQWKHLLRPENLIDANGFTPDAFTRIFHFWKL